MELSQAYATRIKQLMKENRVNLYKLSKMSGVPHPTISVLLSCTRPRIPEVKPF